MRRQSSVNLLAHGFFNWKGSLMQGMKGSRFHPNSLSPAVHGWIRSPCGGSVDHLVTALAWGRCCRWTVITPRLASIQILFLKSVLVFRFLFKPGAITRTNTAVARARLFCIASHDSPSHRDEPLPSHLIWLGLFAKDFIDSFGRKLPLIWNHISMTFTDAA